MKKNLFVLLLFFVELFVLSAFSKTEQENVQNKSGAVPSRIVSLSPASTEILFAVGAQDQIAARTDLCNYPPEAKNIASVGGFDGKLFSLESIIAFKPDFVYLTAVMHSHLIEPLKAYGIPIYVSDVQSVDDILKEIQDIAEITGHKEQGQICVENIKNEFAQAEKITENLNLDKKPSVYWEIWNSPYMSVGNRSFLNEIIQIAGLSNIFENLSQPYPSVSEESIIAKNPDIIVFPSDAMISAKDIKNRRSWKNIEAVKNNRIYSLDGDLMSRSGPRIGKAALALAELAQKSFEGQKK